jgi:hypothetical protein
MSDASRSCNKWPGSPAGFSNRASLKCLPVSRVVPAESKTRTNIYQASRGGPPPDIELPVRGDGLQPDEPERESCGTVLVGDIRARHRGQ